MSEPRPRVGVVVLNYRGADDTVACLDSLRRLDEPCRIVVVDNASADGSAERLAAEADVELVVNGKNLGFGAGNNVAIERLLAGGCEFVWVLNNDTVVAPGSLRAMLAVADADERVGVVGAVIYDAEYRERVLTWGGGAASRWTGRTADARRPDDRVDYVTGASMLLRARALAEVGLFDERYFFTWEDVDLCARLRARGWGVAVAADATVWHRWGATLDPLSPLRMEEHAAGLVVFMRTNSPVPWLTTLPMLLYYAVTAARQRRMALLSAAWRGWRRGWRR